LNIPVVAIVDTNCNPDLVTYPIAANDDAIRSVRVILSTVCQVLTQARAEYEAKYARRQGAEGEGAATAAAAPASVPAAEPAPGGQAPATPAEIATLLPQA
jgi:small subunit ribosomal protein S2